jgi:hypothetical protein
LGCDFYWYTEVKRHIRNREVRIIKWFEVFHLESTSISTCESRIHISVAEDDHTSTECSSHLGEISLDKIRGIYRIKYCCRHMEVFFLELFLHLMDLDTRIPDAMDTEKTIRLKEVFGDEKLRRLSRSVRSFYDDECTRTLFGREKYLFFGFREGSIFQGLFRSWHR